MLDKIVDAFKRNNLDGVKVDIEKNAVEVILPPVIDNNVDTTALPPELQIIKRSCSDSIFEKKILAIRK